MGCDICGDAAAECYRGTTRRDVEGAREEAGRPVQHQVRPASGRSQSPVDDRLRALGHEQPSQLHGLLAVAVGARARPSPP
eukprot:239034-Pyramimonas_sp.AAC.1